MSLKSSGSSKGNFSLMRDRANLKKLASLPQELSEGYLEAQAQNTNRDSEKLAAQRPYSQDMLYTPPTQDQLYNESFDKVGVGL